MAQVFTNMWDKIKIVCPNHAEPKEMKIVKNTEKIASPFYGCTKYFPDKENIMCPNRINLDDYQGICLKFLTEVGNSGLLSDFTGMKFQYKGGRHKLSIRVAKYTNEEIILEVRNLTVFGE